VLLNSSLIKNDLMAVVEDVDGIVAHDEFGRLFLLEEQRRRRLVAFGRSTFLLLRIDLSRDFEN